MSVVAVDEARAPLRRPHSLGRPQLRARAGRAARRARAERHGQDVAVRILLGLLEPTAGQRRDRGLPAAGAPPPHRLRAAAARLRPRPGAARPRPRAARSRRPPLGLSAALGDAQRARIDAALDEVGATGVRRRADRPPLRWRAAAAARRAGARLRPRAAARRRAAALARPRLPARRSSACSTSAAARAGTPVVFVTHDINPVLPSVDRVLYLAPGQLGDRHARRGDHLRDAVAPLRHATSTCCACAAASSSSARRTTSTSTTWITATDVHRSARPALRPHRAARGRGRRGRLGRDRVVRRHARR